MNTYTKFTLIIVAIIGTLVWLAAGGINETKTYYKTVAELQQMGDKAMGKRIRVAGGCGRRFHCPRRPPGAIRPYPG